MRILFVLVLTLVFLGVGCGRKKSAVPSAGPYAGVGKDQKLIITPENALVGKVVSANPDARFVILSFPIGHLPAMDQRLNVYRRGLRVGEVKITGPQQDDKIAADLIAGDSAVGDEVRDR